MSGGGPSNPFARWDVSALRRRRSVKWALVGADELALWVAEMDTYAPEPVVDAVRRLLRDGDTGYPVSGAAYAEAFAGFAADRWGWDVPTAHTRPVNDVMTGVAEALRHLTGAGDPVILTPPVYAPFRQHVAHLGRTVVNAALGADGRLDLTTLEEAFDRSHAPGVRPALLLSSPHNPTGVVHTAAELGAVAELAARYGVAVVVDEIHAALTYAPHVFVPYLAVPGTEDAVVVTSGAKAFNLAGIKAALMIPGSASVLSGMPTVVDHTTSALGLEAHRAAFTEGGPWLAEHLAGLAANRAHLADVIADELPDASWRAPEATYLAWLDLRAYAPEVDPAALLRERAGVWLVPGPEFGPGGDGFARLNFATAPAVLTEALQRMRRVLPPA